MRERQALAVHAAGAPSVSIARWTGRTNQHLASVEKDSLSVCSQCRLGGSREHIVVQ